MSKVHRGDELVQQAEKTMQVGFMSRIFGSKADRARDAAELYDKAANAYKLDKTWDRAGRAFLSAAEHYIISDDKPEAAYRFENAATAFKKIDHGAAINALNKAIVIYREMGRFNTAARLEKEIGETYENDDESALAVEHYKLAADYYEGEGQNTNRDNCLLKAAHISALLGHYNETINIFESISSSCASDNLRKFSIRDYLLKAGLCHLNTGDTVAVRQALENYTSMYFEWGNSRECKLLTAILDAVEDNDEAAFSKAVREFDNISQLDKWKTSMLLRIQERIKNQESEIL
ncbi:uncharacterized protein LOC126323915 [Schistocerca gregaria]|uniref:uncharacterized protein LOC126323915 n=1 Tax=Schistocerca gregaria TaxID=7010 RepID=UPI00211E00BB|nr:uncharacterized protein LOC126323915 [Schistocerca gregaria]